MTPLSYFFRSILKDTMISIVSFSIFHSGFAQTPNEKATELLNITKTSYNNRDWQNFTPILSDTFSINDNYYFASIIDAYVLYSYPDLSPEYQNIDTISIMGMDTTKPNTLKIEIIRHFSNAKDKSPVSLEFLKDKQGYKLIKASQGFKPTAIGMPGISYGINTDLFDKNKIQFLFPERPNKNIKKKGAIYYEPQFRKYVNYNEDINQIQNLVLEWGGFQNLGNNMALHLTTGTKTTIYVSPDSAKKHILKVEGLGDNDSINIARIEREIYTILPHEFAESQLMKNTGIWAYNNRWYADGFSEYMAYSITRKFDKNLFQDSYIEGNETYARFEEYTENKQNDNLLDWAIDRKSQNVNALVGATYTYWNDSGQYGRALQFFIDFVEDYDQETLRQIHKHFKGSKNVSQQELLDYMNKITGDNIKERISSY